MKNTTGIFHKKGTQVQFDPVRRADILKRFLEYYSGETHDVRGFTYEGSEYTGPKTWAKGDIDKLIAEGGTDGFDPHFRQILGGHPKTGKRCGQAKQGAQYSVCYDQPGCTDNTTPHERLHNGDGKGTPVKRGTGLGHSHVLRNGKIDKMGDKSSTQGSNDHIVGMPAPYICLLGWNDPNDTVVIEETSQVLIAPVENEATHDNEYRFVIVRAEGHKDVYLSLRLPYPYDSGDPRIEKLYVHEIFPDGHPDLASDFPNATLRYKPDMMPGDTVELPNGATVNYMSMLDGIADVDVTFDGDIIVVDDIQLQALPSHGAPPTSGSYYAPVSSGHGWDVHVNDKGEMVGYWFTGRDSGEPRWLYFEGVAGTELDLFEIVGATVQDPTTGKPEKVGSCRFTGDRFAFRLNGIRGGIKVVPLLPTPSLSGIYYYPGRDKEGIALHCFTDAEGVERCSVNFYTYRRNAYGVRFTDTWYSCEGVRNEQTKMYTLTIYETEGRFQSFGAKTKVVGTGSLSVRGDVADFGFAIGKRVEDYTMGVLFRG